MNHTWLEISSSAFTDNIVNIKNVIGGVKLGLMLKADAYGHGLVQMAQLAQVNPNIEYIFVTFAGEALQLRTLGITKPICVLVLCDTDLEKVIANDIEMVLYDRAYMIDVMRAAHKVGKAARIHLEIDTGMSRLGMLPEEALAFLEELKHYPQLKTVGLMTHLCDADDPSPESLAFTQQQLDCFDEVICKVPIHIAHTLEIIHACASAGTIFFHNNFSLVRIGELNHGYRRLVRVATNAFGYYKPVTQRARLAASNITCDVRPIMTWKTRIIQLKKIPMASFVGYNRTYCTRRETVIAVLPIGYFDGYSRALSNIGSVLVRGCYAPIIGRVSMNLCTIDVTDVPGVNLYDEVILMGDYVGITADDLAHKTGTINLAILTSIHPSIQRIIIEDTCLLSKATLVPVNLPFSN